MSAFTEAVLAGGWLRRRKSRFKLATIGAALFLAIEGAVPVHAQQSPSPVPTASQSPQSAQEVPTPMPEKWLQGFEEGMQATSKNGKYIILPGYIPAIPAKSQNMSDGVVEAIRDALKKGKYIIVQDSSGSPSKATGALDATESAVKGIYIITVDGGMKNIGYPGYAEPIDPNTLTKALSAVDSQKQYISALENQVKNLKAEVAALKQEMQKTSTPK
jgi:hypothetical protein